MSLFGRARRAREASGTLHAAAIEYFVTGQMPADAPAAVDALQWDATAAELLWKAHRVALLAEAKRRGVSPFGLGVFEGRELPGLPAWGSHFADPRPVLNDRPVLPCPRCGSSDPAPLSCLALSRPS
jgi:hypothetical protein